MLYLVCPTCGTLLGNIQLPYQRDIEALCNKYDIDHETISRAAYSKEFMTEKEKIVNKYVDNMCCKMRLVNFSDIVRIIN